MLYWVVLLVLIVFSVIVYALYKYTSPKKIEGLTLDDDPANVPEFAANTTFILEFPNTQKYRDIKANGKASVNELKNAMMNRALNVTHNIIRAKRESSSITNAKQQNLCPESLWVSFNESVKQLNEEIKTLQEEASEMTPGWGEQIIPQAEKILIDLMKKDMEAKKKEAELKEKINKKNGGNNDTKQTGKDAKRVAALADRTFKQLMKEEERLEKQKKKTSKRK